MKRITTYTGLPAKERGAAIALGNFDGLHRGHQVVIERAKQVALSKNIPLAVACFRPHPSRYFNPETPPFRLMSSRLRARILADMGVDYVYEIPFDAALMEMDDETFVQTVLQDGLAVQHVVVGEDFKFGKKRCGDFDSLKRLCAAQNITVDGIAPISLHQSYGKYGSTEIREALRQGDVFFAAHMLSRPWIVDGMVVKGDQLGRTLGFPTANIDFADRIRPRAGIYAAECRLDGETTWLPGVAYVGERPTVEGSDYRLEMHIFDFDQDIYGRNLEVAFRTFVRDDVKFDGLEALTVQIAKDVHGARAILGLL